MALNPDQIEQTEFGSSLRGFDKQEVRAFLARVARSMRELEGERAETTLAAASAVPPRPAPSDMSDEDRFGELGERIANLLRNAHDSAATIKANADVEVTQMRIAAESDVAEAQTEVQRARAEAAEIIATAEADAVEIRLQAERDGLAKLDDRQAVIEANELSIQQDQKQALAELADARNQVSALLEQARAQSEFIRLEADDIIREKIRSNLEAAEGRLTVIRNTESISRERIRLAQNELESALGRLESEPAPELPHGQEHLVIEEAEERALEAGYVVGSVGAEYGETADEVTYETADEVTYETADDASYGEAVDEAVEVIEVESTDIAAEVDALVADDDTLAADIAAVDEAQAAAHDVADAAEFHEEPVFGTGSAPSPLAEAEDEAEDEDALTRLVREAMQSAVETARNGE